LNVPGAQDFSVDILRTQLRVTSSKIWYRQIARYEGHATRVAVAVEHVLNEYNNVRFAAQHGNTTASVVQQYMLKSHHHLFTYIGYSHACAVFASVAAALATFSWNFMDLFISVTSIALTERFHVLNRNLQAIKGKVTASYSAGCVT
jgi:hypothetical protein